MTQRRKHTQEAIKQRGEVFTPTKLVNEVLDKLPQEVFMNHARTFLDNSCGNGQFLDAVLKRKMENGISHLNALETIYGVELDPFNAEECRQRLLMGSTKKSLREVVDENIICADALDPQDPGWKKVGYMWNGPEPVKRTFLVSTLISLAGLMCGKGWFGTKKEIA